MLSIERLEDREAPAILTHDGLYETNFQWGPVFDGYHGPLSMAASELPGDLGHFRLVAGARIGGGPRVVVGTTAHEQVGGEFPIQRQFDDFVFESSFTGGVSVALGDVNGDGVDDVVVGAGPGGGPRVRVLDGTSLQQIGDFFAFETSFTGGVTVAAGDLDGDGRAEIVVGPGEGGGPRVAEFTGQGSELTSFFTAEPTSREGAQVAVGDVLYLDGSPEVIAATGHQVSVFERGVKRAAYTVLAGELGPVSLAVGYVGQSLVPHVVVAGGTKVESWDSNPLFLDGRRFFSVDYGEAVQVGTMRLLDGVARFDQRGINLSTSDYEVYDARWPLSQPLGGPAPGGAAIGPVGATQTGTLTGYVRGDDGLIYALTNRHVVSVDHGNPVGEAIEQPGEAFKGPFRPFAHVTSYIPLNTTNKADASLSLLDDQTDFDPRSAYGVPGGSLAYVQPHGLGRVERGQLVYKFGFWGVALGLVVATDVTVHVRDGNATYDFVGQTVVAQADSGVGWIQPGDSGSLITDANGLRVGQAFAGNGSIGIFTPIDQVFEELHFHGTFVG